MPPSLNLVDPAVFYPLSSLLSILDAEGGVPNAVGEVRKQTEAPVLATSQIAKHLDSVLRAMEHGERRFKITKTNKEAISDDLAKLRELLMPKGSDYSLTLPHVLHRIVVAAHTAFSRISELSERLSTPYTFFDVDGTRRDAKWRPRSKMDMELFQLEVNVNRDPILARVQALVSAQDLADVVRAYIESVLTAFDAYFTRLEQVHREKGMPIQTNAMLTDFAYLIYKNTDAHGEIDSDGRKPDEVSAYAVSRATSLLEAAEDSPLLREAFREPKTALNYAARCLQDIVALVRNINTVMTPAWAVLTSTPLKAFFRTPTDVSRDLENAYGHAETFEKHLNDLDPCSITHRPTQKLRTSEEIYEEKFLGDTLAWIIEKLCGTAAPDAKEVVTYILERKAALRKHQLIENSFYKCEISEGNPFLGVAPGALVVQPATKPNISLQHVRGSGFAELIQFLKSVAASAKYNPLFIATSPSGSADKANVLLVGPPGGGKTEAMRAVASERDSIAISVVGSDFNTCWRGEQEKNPKRLFEAAVKLQREAGRRVHIMVDEIDTVLNSDRGADAFGGTNLTTEFQIMLDGLTHYENISFWGATNFLNRIPRAMIRRFSKVLLIGKLTQQDRIELLHHYLRGLPLHASFSEAVPDAAKLLEGATGDVMRKVADAVWRDKLEAFTDAHPEKAEALSVELRGNAPAGTPFSSATFTQEQRDKLKAELSGYLSVTGAGLIEQAHEVLDDVTIREDIRTATQTYADAEETLTKLRTKAAFKREPQRTATVDPPSNLIVTP